MWHYNWPALLILWHIVQDLRLPSVTTIAIPEGYDWRELLTYMMKHHQMEMTGGLGPSVGMVSCCSNWSPWQWTKLCFKHCGHRCELTFVQAVVGVTINLSLSAAVGDRAKQLIEIILNYKYGKVFLLTTEAAVFLIRVKCVTIHH